jgi:hypothetical protein
MHKVPTLLLKQLLRAPHAQGDYSPQTIFEAPYVQGASSTSQTKLEQLKFYQIFILEKDLK